MEKIKTSGEGPCNKLTSVTHTDLIVITGGPGAGKTALLEFVRKIYCPHVAILPEAAGILFGGGFWRLESPTARNACQRAIFHIQREMENLVLQEKSWIIGLCDRGSLDGLAYWEGEEEEFFENLGTTKEKELQRYKAVLHLASPDQKSGYNQENPLRKESADDAQRIDRRIQTIWSAHPHYVSLDCQNNFLDKLQISTQKLMSITNPILAQQHDL